MNEALFSSKNMNWCTPQEFFDELNAEFHFALDAAATDKSAKCPKYYTPETDGLKQPWIARGGFCFLQSSVRKANRRMGAEGVRRSAERDDDRSSYSVPHGHGIFSRLHLRQSGIALRARPLEVHRRRRQREAIRAVSVNGCCI